MTGPPMSIQLTEGKPFKTPKPFAKFVRHPPCPAEVWRRCWWRPRKATARWWHCCWSPALPWRRRITVAAASAEGWKLQPGEGWGKGLMISCLFLREVIWMKQNEGNWFDDSCFIYVLSCSDRTNSIRPHLINIVFSLCEWWCWCRHEWWVWLEKLFLLWLVRMESVKAHLSDWIDFNYINISIRKPQWKLRDHYF